MSLEQKLTRREVLKLGLIALAEAMLPNFLTNTANAEENKDIPSDEEIKYFMAKDSVEDILEGSNIEYITPDNWNKKIQNSELPALVFVYDNNFKGYLSKRMAIIMRYIAQKYKGKINVYACRGGISIGRKRLWPEHNIKGPPSVAMYARYDLTKEETPQQNNGEMKQIDILAGGPTADKWINPWINWLKPWLDTNILKPNCKYAIRMNNSSEDRKVFYKCSS